MSGSIQRTYLDFNATAPVLPEVTVGIAEVLGMTGNPSSVHQHGRRLRALIEDARESVAALIQCNPEVITFTSGGTEANAMAIRGLREAGVISTTFCSSVEHHSVLDHIKRSHHLPVNGTGILDLDVLEESLHSNPEAALVCVMFANNETGVIQPVKQICDIVHSFGGYVLCDAVQALGKVAFDISGLGADFYTLSAHKIGGTQGVGALINCQGIDLEPLLIGGGQEKKKRSGTENTPGIVGFGIAAQKAIETSTNAGVEAIRNKFEEVLLIAKPEAKIFGYGAQRLPNTTNVALPGVSSEKQVIKLDLEGFSVSSGSACSSGKMAKSHVLSAMGIQTEFAESAIRISIGRETKWDELERFVPVWTSL